MNKGYKGFLKCPKCKVFYGPNAKKCTRCGGKLVIPYSPKLEREK